MTQPKAKAFIIPKDMKSSRVSTAASETPAFYTSTPTQIPLKPSFNKSQRFIPAKPQYTDTPLFLNEDNLKKKPPSVLLKPPLPRNNYLLARDEQEAQRQRLKMVYWKSIPLEMDKLFRSSIGPVLKKQYYDIARLTGVAKRCAMLHYLDKLAILKSGFQQSLRPRDTAPCGVVYRKSAPKPFRLQEIQPGPTHYYPKDDIVRPSLPQTIFGKENLNPKPILLDTRDYNPDYPTSTLNTIIAPLPQIHRLTEDELCALKRGPGYYDCLFKQVQPRPDQGVLVFPALTSTNARQQNCVEIKEVNDAFYFPKYTAIDPSISAPIMKQPTAITPPHRPLSELFPEHWTFYDVDLKQVKAEIAKNIFFSGGLTFTEYQKHVHQLAALKEYWKRQHPTASIGQYDIKYTAIDPSTPNVLINLAQQRNLEPIEKVQGHLEGDNLILNPQPVATHIPGVEFSKMEGRPEKDATEEGDVLILNPAKLPPYVPSINMKLVGGRQESEVGPEGREGDRLLLNPQHVQTHIGGIDMSKMIPHQTQLPPEEGEYCNIDLSIKWGKGGKFWRNEDRNPKLEEGRRQRQLVTSQNQDGQNRNSGQEEKVNQGQRSDLGSLPQIEPKQKTKNVRPGKQERPKFRLKSVKGRQR